MLELIRVDFDDFLEVLESERILDVEVTGQLVTVFAQLPTREKVLEGRVDFLGLLEGQGLAVLVVSAAFFAVLLGNSLVGSRNGQPPKTGSSNASLLLIQTAHEQ